MKQMLPVFWGFCGLMSLFWTLREIFRLLTSDNMQRSVPLWLTILAALASVLLTIASVGSWRQQIWGQRGMVAMSLLFGVYAVSFVLMEGIEYGPFMYAIAVMIAAMAIVTSVYYMILIK